MMRNSFDNVDYVPWAWNPECHPLDFDDIVLPQRSSTLSQNGLFIKYRLLNNYHEERPMYANSYFSLKCLPA